MAPELAPAGAGRRYLAARTVCLGDVLPAGQVRLDSLARYLQDVAHDDGVDAAIDNDRTWVVRRTTMSIIRRPVLGDQLGIVTWASAAGGRWAERRTTIRSTACSGSDAMVEASALWVCLDGATRRPARLSSRFWEMYGESVGDRSVSPRLTHLDPPAEWAGRGRPWPLRVADIDVFADVNNAATWTAIEDELERQAGGRRLEWAEVEYRSAIDPDTELWLRSQIDSEQARVWLVAPGGTQASAIATFASTGGATEG